MFILAAGPGRISGRGQGCGRARWGSTSSTREPELDKVGHAERAVDVFAALIPAKFAEDQEPNYTATGRGGVRVAVAGCAGMRWGAVLVEMCVVDGVVSR